MEPKKIPTIVALAILVSFLFVGATVFTQFQKKQQQATKSITQKQEVKVVNITENSATITWQTGSPTVSEVKWGATEGLENTSKDDRDATGAKPHLLHFATLKKLKPQTRYFFKIKDGPNSTPPTTLSFTTLIVSHPDKELALQKPVIGKVVKNDQSIVDEAFIFLSIPGTGEIGTITTSAGNFVLPISNLRSISQEKVVLPSEAKLVVQRGLLVSQTTIKLPASDTALPSIVLGQNNDTPLIASPSGGILPKDASASANQLDLNKDGTVNNIDLSLIKAAVAKKDLKADVNEDGIADQKDIDFLRQAL